MIRVLIFDLDGTLVETEPLHFQAFAQVLKSEGIELSRQEYFSRLIGYDDRDCLATVLRENNRPETGRHLESLVQRKAAIYGEMIAAGDLLYPGAREFVRSAAERFPLLVVTGTLRAEAETILKRAGLRELFLDLVAAEDVEHGKPEPECFIVALKRIGSLVSFRPPLVGRECLVLEDTRAGIEAAHRAGMQVLALCHTAPASTLGEADLVRNSLAEVDLDDVLSRLGK